MTSITNILANTKGATIANISYTTDVKTAAAHKAMSIVKNTTASVMLANNLKAFTDMYLNKVKKTTTEGDSSNFIKTAAHFEHTDCYSIVHNANLDTYYLFAMFNNQSVSTYIDEATGNELTKEEVATYLAPAAAKKLLEGSTPSYNKKNDVTHAAIVRTIKVSNITSINANGQQYTGPFTA